MHVALRIDLLPKPAVFWISKKSLPSARFRARAEIREVSARQFLNSLAIRVTIHAARYFYPLSDYFDFV